MNNEEKIDLVREEMRLMINKTTAEMTDLVNRISGEDVDWTIFANTNVMLISGLVHHYIENHLVMRDRLELKVYYKHLITEIQRIITFYNENN